MKKLILALILATASTSQAMQTCDPSAKALYKDIQIFKQTEKLSADEGIVGDRLDRDLSTLKFEASLKEKVHAIEVGFARCEMVLNEDDELDVMMNVDAFKKMKNPLITD